MIMTQFKRLLSVILCIVLIAATALFTTGCSNNEHNDVETPSTENVEQTDREPGDTEETGAVGDVKVLGEGAKQFDFTVVDLEGNETKFVIKTDKKTVGEALSEVELISGDEGPYGLYVKTVNGITADYDKDKTYWGFYIDGEYAMTGVEKTNIEQGKTYSFKVSK